MTDGQHYDVVIIGTGAGGGTLGHRLARNGVKVLWLERGPFLPRERDNWQTEAVFVRGKYLAKELWYDRHGREFQPEVNYYVGGNTKFYGAACSASVRRTLASYAIMAESHRPGRSPTTTWSPTTPKPNISTWCMVSTARTRAKAMPVRSTPTLRYPTNPESSS